MVSSETDGYFWPAWSPDLDDATGFQGSVVFEIWTEPDMPVVELHVIDVDVDASGVSGNDLTNLQIDGFHAAWCPLGDKIAYVGNHATPEGIFITDVGPGGGAPTLVILDQVQTNSDGSPNSGAHVDWPAWDPTGTKLAYARYFRDPPEVLHSTIRIREEFVDADGVAVVIDSEVLDLESDFLDGGLQWSPDGNFLAYRANSAIEVLELGTTPTRRSLPETTWAWSPTWPTSSDASPSSDELAFMNRRGTQGSGKRRVVLYDRATDTETVIVERKPFHLFEPDWRQFPRP